MRESVLTTYPGLVIVAEPIGALGAEQRISVLGRWAADIQSALSRQSLALNLYLKGWQRLYVIPRPAEHSPSLRRKIGSVEACGVFLGNALGSPPTTGFDELRRLIRKRCDEITPDAWLRAITETVLDISALTTLGRFRDRRCTGASEASLLEKLVSAYAVRVEQVTRYVAPREEIVGFGRGGSESLVLFVKDADTDDVVTRKVISEELATTRWLSGGTGVMAPPTLRARYQVDFISALPREAAPYFPQVLRYEEAAGCPPAEVVFDQTYMDGISVTSWVRTAQPGAESVAAVYRAIMVLLRERVHCHRTRPRTARHVETQYLSKIQGRLGLANATAPLGFPRCLLEHDRVVLNRNELVNIGPLIEFFRTLPSPELLEPPQLCLTMGDTNTENILITNRELLREVTARPRWDLRYDDLGLRFVDPRSIGTDSSGADTVDDYLYDAKIWHNSIGRYDLLHNDHFELACGLDGPRPVLAIKDHAAHPFDVPYRGITAHFDRVAAALGRDGDELGTTDPSWFPRFVFLMGTHLCAMIPFHIRRRADGTVLDDREHQARAIAMYSEGLLWLNATRSLLLGDLRTANDVWRFVRTRGEVT